jgi:3-deoxy-7-phosphoheptulonate synthase
MSGSYKLVARTSRPEGSTVSIGDVVIGGEEFVVAAGPCAVESKDQLMQAATGVASAGARLLRAGAFKPRTSPYAFQGLAEEGLHLLAHASRLTGLPTVTEVLATEDIPLVAEYSDALQVGARNMQNFALLKALGAVRKPVVLKRGLSATIDELLMAAEYIVLHGNPRVVLCERGIRTFETATRNTLDLNAVALLKQITHLPVIVDPSHGTGRRDLIAPLSHAAVAIGADGLLVEVHPTPDLALSDGAQSITPAAFASLMCELAALAPIKQRQLALGRDAASHRERLASLDDAVDRLLRERARLTHIQSSEPNVSNMRPLPREILKL